MSLHLSPKQKRLIMLLPFACLPAAQAAIQPELDNVYGNSYTLTGGAQIVWNSATDESTFVNRAYAVDGQAKDYVTWTKDQADSRPLLLANSSNWANGSVTWKFVAPTGYSFAGGTIAIQGQGIWTTCSIDLKAYSQYVNDGYGSGGYSAGTGTLYDSDTHSVAEWTWDNWIVDVPTGISEFYVTAAATVDWHTVWANNLQASNVTFAPVPEPAALSLLALGGALLFRRRR